MAPLLVEGELVGPVTLVQNGNKTIGATAPELLRPYVGAQFTVATMLDGSESILVSNWGLSRHVGLGLLELAGPVEPGLDVRPLGLGAVCATLDPRGAPAVLVGIVREGNRFARSWVPVQIDNDAAGMTDTIARLASPLEDRHVGMVVDGASLFAWFPPNPALGRAGEVLVLGLALAYRGFSKPRERPVIAEIVGLDDLGRALIAAQKIEEREPDLQQIAGEIEDDESSLADDRER